ncbi:MAG: hypothetical protein HYS51_02315 [Candidatus Zambryskibacteria bacterium]|nr:hypothetical protein [Candidatus Zambryskibacteria bacterium]
MRLKALTIIFIILWCGIFLSQKIDLVTADIGRHITNGKILVEAPLAAKLALLHTNFYSYTMPDAPFVNHHWASGVIFYFIHKLFGFTGLSVFYVLGSLGAIFLFWNVARKLSSFYIASFFTIVLAPILVSRAEVRPEVFSLLLSGVFLNILFFRKYIWALPILMMLWVNLHIGFIFGFMILGSFCLEDFKKFYKITIVSAILALINPFGYKILLYPFLIFKDYGYRIVENQSVRFLENIGFTAGEHFLLFKIIAGATLISLGLLLYKCTKPPISILLPTLATLSMAYLGIRHFPIFGLFALVFLSYAYQLFFSKIGRDIVLGSSILIIVLLVSFGLKDIRNVGWGLAPDVLNARVFITSRDIKSPIFNNYDVGSYLIYSLYPSEKVFVDNRPEAYTKKFFEEIYVPAQEDESAWRKLDEQYEFNTIIFSHRDYTPWGQKFLAERAEDKDWKAVFMDNYIVIFSKNK